MTAEDVEPPPVEVWPELWPAVQLFARLMTQWYVGFGGPTGLRYSVVMQMLDRMKLEPDEWDEMFEDIRVLEGAALDVLASEK